MKPNENVAKDLAYQQMIYNKLLEIDSRFATLFPYTNMAQDVLEGGTRLREHPLPGVSMATYEPSTLAVGGGRPKQRGPQIQRPYQPLPPKLMRKNSNITTLSAGSHNRMDLVKKIMKEQGLNLPQASKFIKDNGLYQKVEKVIKGGGNKTGKINRLKKAKKWTKFAVDTAGDGLDLAQRATDPFKHVKNLFGGEVEGGGNKSGKISRYKKATKWRDFAKDTANDGLDLYERATDPFKKVKSLFGGDVKPKRAPSQWIQFVKQFAAKNGIPYKEALKAAGPAYKKMKG
jgi:hypothetical protein